MVCEECMACISQELEAWAKDQAHRVSDVDDTIAWTDVIVLVLMGLRVPFGLEADVIRLRNGVNECRKEKGYDLIVPYDPDNNRAQTDAGESHDRPSPKLAET